jgi:hypothetical protein
MIMDLKDGKLAWEKFAFLYDKAGNASVVIQLRLLFDMKMSYHLTVMTIPLMYEHPN